MQNLKMENGTLVKAKDISEKSKSGNCYKSAFEHQQDMYRQGVKLTLVHGLIVGNGLETEGVNFIHAWCELDDIVFDLSNNQEICMRKEEYYMKARLIEKREYSPKEAEDNFIKSGHPGYWSKSLGEKEQIDWGYPDMTILP